MLIWRLLLTVCLAVASVASAARASEVVGSNRSPVVEFRGASYFVGGTGPFEGLYRSDGTQAGTKLVVHVATRNGLESSDLTVVGDHLAFSTDKEGDRSARHYVSDGTLAGTRRTASPPVGPPGRLVARMSDGGSFFVRDGDRAGQPDRLGYLPPGPQSKPVILARSLGNELEFGVLDREFYFAGKDGEHGVEPWVSDGTAAGTRLAADLTPGAASSDLDYAGFIAAGESMYVFAGRAREGENVPHTPYLLTGPGAGTPVRFNGAPAALPLSGQFRATVDALWFQTGIGPKAKRLRVPAGSVVADQPQGAGFDEHQTLLVPGVRAFVSENSLRSTNDQGVLTTLATTGVYSPTKGDDRPAVSSFFNVGDDAWFFAPLVDEGASVLWRSDGTIAGTGPVVLPGQIDPVASTLTAAAQPVRDRRAPFRWKISGTLIPTGIAPDSAQLFCTGTVSLTVSRHGTLKQVTRVRTAVRWNGTACTFTRTVAPPQRAFTARRGKLDIGLRFDGNDHVNPWRVERVAVRYG